MRSSVGKALPSRPMMGRRERWLAVATSVVLLEGGAMKLGISPPAEHVSILLAAIIAFVGADTIRPSGVTRDVSAPEGE